MLWEEAVYQFFPIPEVLSGDSSAGGSSDESSDDDSDESVRNLRPSNTTLCKHCAYALQGQLADIGQKWNETQTKLSLVRDFQPFYRRPTVLMGLNALVSSVAKYGRLATSLSAGQPDSLVVRGIGRDQNLLR